MGVLIGTRAIAKPIVHYATSFLIGADPEEMKRVKPDINNKPKLITEISTKFFVYLAVGFNCLFTVPVVFRAVGCERATFHTEVYNNIDEKLIFFIGIWHTEKK